MKARAAWVVSSLLVACHPATLERSASPSADAVPVTPTDDRPQLPVLDPARLPRVASAPRWVEPTSGSTHPEDLVVRWTPAAPSLPDRLLVMVDDGSFVSMLPGESERPIATLLSPDRVLGPGSHRLVLCLTREGLVARSRNGIPACDVTFFSVGHEVESVPNGIVALLPHGTYSGPSQARNIAVEWLPTGGAEVDHYVVVQIRRDAGAPRRWILAPGPTYLLENLASGDYTLDMQLHDSRGRLVDGPWGRVVRIITVNADVEDETSPAAAASFTAPTNR